jgi:hypothetical protein
MGATWIHGSECRAGGVGNDRVSVLVWFTQIIVAFDQSELMDL